MIISNDVLTTAITVILWIVLNLQVSQSDFKVITTDNNINRCISSFSDLQDKSIHRRKPRWAIVALTKPTHPSLRPRNSALAERIKPYATLYDFTVIFFSEKYVSYDLYSSWNKTFAGVASVRVVNTADRGFTGIPNENGQIYTYGYKYMCKFFALDIYDYLKSYDYYMRCDTDCFIKTLNYDVFGWIQRNNIEYGYAIRKLEAHQPTKQTLPVWVNKYIKQCDIRPSAFMDKPLSVCFNFYNNFHVGKVSFFLRADVRHFLLAVNSSNHILTDRWGDSTIQAYAVRLFMKPSRIAMIPNFSYVHGSHDAMITTIGDGGKSAVPQMLPPWKYSL